MTVFTRQTKPEDSPDPGGVVTAMPARARADVGATPDSPPDQGPLDPGRRGPDPGASLDDMPSADDLAIAVGHAGVEALGITVDTYAAADTSTRTAAALVDHDVAILAEVARPVCAVLVELRERLRIATASDVCARRVEMFADEITRQADEIRRLRAENRRLRADLAQAKSIAARAVIALKERA